MAVADNIKKLRRIYGITQKELADIASVTENAVSKWENGYAEPRMGAVERIAACYGLTKFHIIEDGGMDFVDPVTRAVRRPPNLPDGAIIPLSTRKAMAPLRGGVHAGPPSDENEIADLVELPASVLERHPKGFFLRVEGDCMDHVYPEGCFVLVDKDKEPQNGSIAAFEDENYQAVMRRYFKGANTIVLSPDSHNPEYEDIVLDKNTERTVKLIGTVVWFQASKEME